MEGILLQNAKALGLGWTVFRFSTLFPFLLFAFLINGLFFFFIKGRMDLCLV